MVWSWVVGSQCCSSGRSSWSSVRLVYTTGGTTRRIMFRIWIGFVFVFVVLRAGLSQDQETLFNFLVGWFRTHAVNKEAKGN